MLDTVVGVVLGAVGVMLLARRGQVWSSGLLVAASVAWFAADAVGNWPHRAALLLVAVAPAARRPPPFRWWVPAIGLLLLAAWPQAEMSGAAQVIVGVGLLLLGVARAFRGDRRGPVAVALGATLVAPVAIRRLDPASGEIALVAYEAGLLVFATLVALAGRVRASRAEAAVVELGPAGSLAMEAALGRALGDRSIRVWPGAAAVEQSTAAGRSATELAARGRRIGWIEHDAGRPIGPALAERVAHAIDRSEAVTRLSAELEAQLGELATSERRLAETEEVSSRRIATLLDHTVLARLDELAAIVPAAEAEISAALGGTHDAIVAIAASLPPPGLARGLRPGVEALAAAAPVPVIVIGDATVEEEQVEEALYYACAEAVANAVKHGGPTAITITLTDASVVVTDDGRGGAVVVPGGGLDGLATRVSALGGALTVAGNQSGGTTVTARFASVM